MNSVMKGHKRYPLIERQAEKSSNRGTSILRKRSVDPRKADTTWQTSLRKQTEPPTNRKSTFSRSPCGRRANVTKNTRKEEQIDASSAESTNLSEKQKIDNVLELRREINEWRRQEALESKVNQILEKSSWIDIPKGNNKENGKFDDLPISIKKQSTEEPSKENNLEIKETMSTVRSRSSRRDDRISIPDVTWISVRDPADASARTSLRSVADYLSTIEKEMPLQPRLQRSLCLSTESLQALENAEKLVEEAEKLQLLRLNLNVADDPCPVVDFQGNNEFVDETSAYIRKIVARSFETEGITGVPSPTPEPLVIPPPATGSKSKTSLATCSSSAAGNSYKASADYCLLCSNRSADAADDGEKNTQLPAVVQAAVPADNGISSSSDDKLTVQRGPTISIKNPDLCVQTSSIVDIQPLTRTTDDSNVANFELRHESLAPDNPRQTQQVDRCDASTSITGLALPQPHAVDPKHLSTSNNSNSSRLPVSVAESKHQQLSSSDMDLSLGEPRIIMELDALLSQQRSIIRKVCQSSQALDQLLLQPNESEACNGKHVTASSQVPSSSCSSEAYSAAAADSFDFCSRPSVAVLASSVNPKMTSPRSKENESGKDEAIQLLRLVDSYHSQREYNEKVANNEEKEILESAVHSNESVVLEEKSKEMQADDVKGSTLSCSDTVSSQRNHKINVTEENESSIHKTSHLVESLSDEQSICKQLPLDRQCAIVETASDTKMNNIDELNPVSSTTTTVNTDECVKAIDCSIHTQPAAQQIVSIRQQSIDSGDGAAATKEYNSPISNNSNDNRMTVSLIEPSPLQSSEQQKLNLLKKLESCSIPTRHPQCKPQPFTSTILKETLQPTIGSIIESSELSSVAAHSEGELYLSSSASYSLGEVRRKNVDYSSISNGSSTKVSSNSDSSQLKTPPVQRSIGEFVESTK